MPTNGLVVMTPTSIAYSGTSASINADGSVTFSAVTSLSLNGVFTSSYDNYMVAYRLGSTASASDGVFARLRASGTDASTNYTRQFLAADGTNVTGGRTTSTTATVFADTRTGLKEGFVVYMYGPYLAQPTAGRSNSVMSDANARFTDYAWTHSTSTAYDGFTSFLSSGNYMTGLVTVFAYNQ